MSKRNKASILAFGKKRCIDRKCNVVVGTSGDTEKGVIYIDTTAGKASGDVYIAQDTAGTSAQIDT